MTRDFGPGMTIDEIIGLSAWHINTLELPPEPIFESADRASSVMMEAGLDDYILTELWGDGHSVWRNMQSEKPVVVSSTGQINRS
jgi:hypothetical protein